MFSAETVVLDSFQARAGYHRAVTGYSTNQLAAQCSCDSTLTC